MVVGYISLVRLFNCLYAVPPLRGVDRAHEKNVTLPVTRECCPAACLSTAFVAPWILLPSVRFPRPFSIAPLLVPCSRWIFFGLSKSVIASFHAELDPHICVKSKYHDCGVPCGMGRTNGGRQARTRQALGCRTRRCQMSDARQEGLQAASERICRR